MPPRWNLPPPVKASNSKLKSHICPPSSARHPSDRWETAFIYAFILKFTSWRSKIEGFESVSDLEEAIISPTQHPLLVQVLTRFILMLRPGTRNLNSDQLSSTLSSVMQEHMKASEKTCFWDEDQQKNVDPLQTIEGGFWAADWDVKLKILRMIVELALVHNQDVRDTIDRAWGVVHNKHRKKETLVAPPDASDPRSKENLTVQPIGQDINRKRYWVFDDSPRLFMSTNPWKVTSEFKTVARTKEEYERLIGSLAAEGPSEIAKRRSKPETAHLQLVAALRGRLEAIDIETLRVQKARRKLEQKEILRAQAEMRVTRTRRQTRRPDYVYNQDFEDDDEGEDYTYQDDDDEHVDGVEDEFDDAINGRRRSQRTAARNVNGKRTSDADGEWRGERRSSRLAADGDVDDGSRKRARTEERSVSSAPSDSLALPLPETNGSASKENGAAAVKGHEVVMEQVPGKKKSKFWFYAVEPVAGANSGPAQITEAEPSQIVVEGQSQVNGSGKQITTSHQNGFHDDRADTPSALFSAEEKA